MPKYTMKEMREKIEALADASDLALRYAQALHEFKPYDDRDVELLVNFLQGADTKISCAGGWLEKIGD